MKTNISDKDIETWKKAEADLRRMFSDHAQAGEFNDASSALAKLFYVRAGTYYAGYMRFHYDYAREFEAQRLEVVLMHELAQKEKFKINQIVFDAYKPLRIDISACATYLRLKEEAGLPMQVIRSLVSVPRSSEFVASNYLPEEGEYIPTTS